MSSKWEKSSREGARDDESHRANDRKGVTETFIRHQGSRRAQITSSQLP